MTTLPDLKREMARQKGETMDKYDGLYLFFEKEINEICEKSKEEWIQTGVQNGIYNTIYRYLRMRYGAKAILKELNDKIDSINYYPALEEVQDAAWSTSRLLFLKVKSTKLPKSIRPKFKRHVGNFDRPERLYVIL